MAYVLIEYGNGCEYEYSSGGDDSDRPEVLRHMVTHLIKHDSSDFVPRVKWWQFWRKKFADDITAEYVKQTT